MPSSADHPASTLASTLATHAMSSDLRGEARAAAGDVPAALVLARRLGAQLPDPGDGRTAARWQALADLAHEDLTVARVCEAHLDAVSILHEAGMAEQVGDACWGVFAAEAPGAVLVAETRDGVVRLTGTKAWCSLADRLDRALVTARLADGGRGLFAVDLRGPGVVVDPPGDWVAHGLPAVTSTAIHLDAVPAVPVGGPGWYLQRPGFAWGGIGVAACWLGGAAALRDRLLTAAVRRDDRLTELHVGTVDVALHAATAALAHAASIVDAAGGRTAPTGDDAAVLAARTRTVVADAVETVLRQVGHALGPAPLAFDAEHVQRVADLQLYVRQHHGERDLADLGHLLLAGRRAEPA